jgi:hypothetical protein
MGRRRRLALAVDESPNSMRAVRYAAAQLLTRDDDVVGRCRLTLGWPRLASALDAGGQGESLVPPYFTRGSVTLALSLSLRA